MTINEIIDYMVNSPENSNPNVLRSMLNSLNVGGGQDNDIEIIEFHIDEEEKLDLTWQEIKDALDRDAILLTKIKNSYGIILGAILDENTYVVGISFLDNSINYFVADSANGYPQYTEDNSSGDGDVA